MQFDDDVQLTLWRIAPTTPAPAGVGLGTMDQELPSQCSINAPVGFPFPPLSVNSVPTPQQSDPLTQVTVKIPPPSPVGSGGVAFNVHDV